MFLSGCTPQKHDFSCFYGISFFRFFWKIVILEKTPKNTFLLQKDETVIFRVMFRTGKIPLLGCIAVQPWKRVVKNTPISWSGMARKGPKKGHFPYHLLYARARQYI